MQRSGIEAFVGRGGWRSIPLRCVEATLVGIGTFVLHSAEVAAATQYYVEVGMSQGGIPAEIMPTGPYYSLQAAEAAATKYVNWLVPTPSVLPYPTESLRPTNGRNITLAGVRRTASEVRYVYFSDWFAFQFENLSSISCAGNPAKDDLNELVGFLPIYSQSVEAYFGCGPVLSASVNALVYDTQNLRKWAVSVTYSGNDPPLTATDSIQAYRTTVEIVATEDPKCTMCPCDIAGDAGTGVVGNPISASSNSKSAILATISAGSLSFGFRATLNKSTITW